MSLDWNKAEIKYNINIRWTTITKKKLNKRGVLSEKMAFKYIKSYVILHVILMI